MAQYTQVPSWEFDREINKLEDQYRPFITWYPIERLQSFRCYLSRDKQSGFAITKYGTIVNLFSHVRDRGADLCRAAIVRGGRYVECFDGHLTGLYKSNGFVEVNRVSFDPLFASPCWDYACFGRPDVVSLIASREGIRTAHIGGKYYA